MATGSEKRDSLGCVYDSTWVDDYGDRHYYRERALGRAHGPAEWTESYDCNPICGCHLEAKCLFCSVCLTCDGCYCREGL